MASTIFGRFLDETSVNQRETTASATDAMPPSRTVLMRAFQPSGVPMRAAVLLSTRLAETIGGVDAEPLAERAAYRDATEMCALDFQRIKQADHIARQSFDGVRTRRDGGEAVAAHIVAQDTKFLGEGWNLRVPHRESGAKRIREHDDRRAVRTVHLIIEACSVRVYEGHVRCFLSE